MKTDRLQRELDYRRSRGLEPVSLKFLKQELAELGYKLDRRLDCKSNTRHMSGERCGQSYPAINLYVVEADTGLSFAHVEARRDENHARLQHLRYHGTLFAVVRGYILEI